jgi:DNA repair exonuclease SbcCD ATPase subunit
VGEPRDKQLLKHPELLLKTQVQRKSAELTNRRDELEAEREAKSKEVVRLQDLIALVEWVIDGAPDIREMGSRLQQLHELEAQAQTAAAQLPDAVDEIQRWEATLATATQAQRLQQKLEETRSKLESIRLEVEKNEAALVDVRNQSKEAVTLLEQAEGLESRRARLEQLSSLETLRSDFELKRTAAIEARTKRDRVGSTLEEERLLLIRTESAGKLMRLWKRLPRPEEQQQVVATLDKALV